MKIFINIYTYCICSILLFGVGLLSTISLYPVQGQVALAADSFNNQMYTAVSIDYSNLALDKNLS